ncbi:MAG TPA: AIR synthase related protein, partial [Parafilimonas sp.]|nr:AIR synthase related protein [Parafilimonas sp.]
VAEKGREDEVIKVFEKWDLPCTNIGEVTDDGLLKFYLHGKLEAEIPAHDLVLGGGAPQYTREYTKPAYLKNVDAFNIDSVKDIDEKDVMQIAKEMIALPNISSKRWISIQYDSTVGAANTSTNAPSDAAIVLAKGTNKALVVTVDCNGRYAFADPYKGAMIAVAEAARNIVCSGGEPIGVTNCLNFGNPYNPEVYYQFVKAVEGMGEACKKFHTPVTGGNVSFYNQNPDGPVYPTPTIGMVGVLDDFNNRMTLDFKNAGDIIVLIGTQQNDIASSEYLHKIKGVEFSPAPAFDMDEEYAVQKFLVSVIKEKLIVSAHDLSEGGLIVALFESAFNNNLGFEINVEVNTRNDTFWFGEAQSRILISCSKDKLQSLKNKAASSGIDICVLGKVTSGGIMINNKSWSDITEWKTLYDTSIEKKLNS